jgi:hypothetical protein
VRQVLDNAAFPADPQALRRLDQVAAWDVKLS